MNENLYSYMIAGALVLSAGLANATLIGDEVNYVERAVNCQGCGSPNIITANQTVTVLEGAIELSNLNGWDVDVEASSVSLTAALPQGYADAGSGFVGVQFLDLDWVGQPSIITGFDLTTNITGLVSSRISFGDDFVWINFSALGIAQGEYAEVALQTTRVPEPTTLALFGLGLAGIGAARRKKLAA